MGILYQFPVYLLIIMDYYGMMSCEGNKKKYFMVNHLLHQLFMILMTHLMILSPDLSQVVVIVQRVDQIMEFRSWGHQRSHFNGAVLSGSHDGIGWQIYAFIEGSEIRECSFQDTRHREFSP